jgi:DNA-binding MarR family transcriptional regulator
MLKTPRRKRDLKLQETLALPDSIVLEQGAGFLLRIASARANALFEELTAQSAITPQQYGTLLTLHQRGTLTPSELAEAIHTDRSTLGEIVRRLGGRNLVRLGKNGADGRSKKVSITAAGETALRRLAHGGVQVQDALLSAVPTKHRPMFMRYLKLVALGAAAE